MESVELDRVRAVSWLNAYDVDDGLVLVRRDEKGHRRKWRYPHYPYRFFIRLDDLPRCRDRLKELKRGGSVHQGKIEGEWLAIYCANSRGKGDENPRNRVVDVLQGLKIQTHEADLSNWERFCIDNAIGVATNHRIAYFDIETRDDQGPIEIGRDQIVSIGVIDNAGARHFFCGDDEEAMLLEATKHLASYDIIVGYNSERFDYPYITERLKRFNLPRLPREVAHLDAYMRLERTVFRIGAAGGFVSKSWRLDDVADAIIGRRKIQNPKGTWWAFQNDRALLELYNMTDVELLKGIVETLSLIETMQRTCEISGRFFTGLTRVGEILDTFILRNANAKGIHYPTIYRSRFRESESSEEVAGGLVVDANVGMHRNVHVYDYSAMYPSIIMAWNIGPDTYVQAPSADDIKAINGHGYRREPGIFATAIKTLLDERKKFQAEVKQHVPGTREANNATVVQTIMKELGNSMFGIFAFQAGRYYKKEIAESITLAGQWLLKQSIAHFEGYGGVVVFADTDSCAVTYPDGVDPVAVKIELEKELAPLLKREYNIDDAKFLIKYEKFYSRLIVVTKKHYAGWIQSEEGVPSNRMFIRGLEVIKRDSVPIAREAQEELLKILLHPDSPFEELLESSKKHVEEWRRRIFEDDIPTDMLVLRQSVNKELSQYKSPMIHTQIAREYRADGMELFTGQDVQYIVTGSKPTLHGVPRYKFDPDVDKWDRRYYWSHRIYSSMRRLLESVYPEYPWKIYEVGSISDWTTTQGILL